MGTKRFLGAGVASLACAAFAMASGSSGAPVLVLTVNGESLDLIGAPTGVPNVFNYTSSLADSSLLWDFSASNVFDPQASFMGGTMLVRNLTSVAKSFEISLTMPVMASGLKASLYGGSASAAINGGPLGGEIRLLDGQPFWTAVAGGGFSRSLLSEVPFPVAASAGQTVMLGSDSFGQPVPDVHGPNLATSMSMVYRFTLDPSVAVSITSGFTVQVPAPGAIALLGAVGLVAGRRRRN
jgi:MYXO-CTERM domain-containing protein